MVVVVRMALATLTVGTEPVWMCVGVGRRWCCPALSFQVRALV